MTQSSLSNAYVAGQLPTNTQDNHKLYTSIEWEHTEYFSEVIKYLKEQNIKSFMDIGGCTGEVSNVILNHIPTIEHGLIFEPHPINCEYIKENINLDKIKLENKAVFYGEKSISLSIRGPNVGSWSFLFSEQYPENSFEVECVELDDYLSEYEYDFIKIDIEGSEFNLLKNSTLLKEVKYIELEVHHEHFGMYMGGKNSKYDSAIDFVLNYLPNHEVLYFLTSDFENENSNPGTNSGNIFLVKK
jgi:FkbM family methyltransferase